MDINKGLIEVLKENIYERNMKSKVLAVYCVEIYTDNLDESLMELVNPIIKYVSYKHTTSEEHLASMHANECKNRKVRYKTLFEIKIDNSISCQNESYELKDLLLYRRLMTHSSFLL